MSPERSFFIREQGEPLIHTLSRQLSARSVISRFTDKDQ